MSGEFGYTGKILRIDLSSLETADVPTSEYAGRFIGGRGIAAKIYWDEVPPRVKALDPDNRLIFMTGPLAGVSPGVGAVRWVVCGKSPATTPEQFSYSNLGGSWGTELKRAGYDGVIVQGKAERPVYLSIEDGKPEIKDASALWGKSTVATRDILKAEMGSQTRVLAVGPAGENMASMAIVLADNDASGTGGFGAVMGSKNLKAIAVIGNGKIATAHPEKLAELNRHIRQLLRASPAESLWNMRSVPEKKKVDVCRGCSLGCQRLVYEAKDGRQGKFICGAAGYYQARAQRFYGEKDWSEIPFKAAMLANDYGVDVFNLGVMMMWLSRCHHAGILTDESTGIPLSQMGSLEFIEALIRKLSLREGFGDVIANGVVRAAEIVGKGSEKLITDYVNRGEQGVAYDPRYFITTGLFYAMEPRQPIQQLHEVSRPILQWMAREASGRGYVTTDVLRGIARRFWGSELAADLSTYEDKAMAAIRIQDRQYAKESMILCDWIWPIMMVEFSEDHIGDPSLESKVFSAATGEEVDEAGLNVRGERIVNLQRAIFAREAGGNDTIAEFLFTTRQRDDPMNPRGIAPGKDGEIFIKKGAVVDRVKFEEMKKEFYRLRGWDAESGLQTRARLEALDLKDVAATLENRRLLA